jgi:hypothetical protein
MESDTERKAQYAKVASGPSQHAPAAFESFVAEFECTGSRGIDFRVG